MKKNEDKSLIKYEKKFNNVKNLNTNKLFFQNEIEKVLKH